MDTPVQHDGTPIPVKTDSDNDLTLNDLDAQMGFLAELSQKFATSLSLDDTLQSAVEGVINYVDAEAASLFMLENSETELVCRVCVGPINITGLRLDAGTGIVGRTVKSNQVQLIRDAGADPDFAEFTDELTGFTTRSVLCAPLRVKDKLIGCLEIINKASDNNLFDETDRLLIETLAAAASLAIHNASMSSRLLQQERLRKELELAREIQTSLLPRAREREFPFHGVNVPAMGVSGDFYSWVERPDGRYAFCLGDVSGKGMNAALLMAKTISLLDCLSKDIDEPGRLLERVNTELLQSITRGMFVTVVAGIYNPQARHIVWANAGHQPPLIRDIGGKYREISANALPLGILPDTSFPQHEEMLDENIMYLFTDGITEGYGADAKPLEVNGLMAMLDAYHVLEPRERLAKIVSDLEASSAELRDDVTMMIINDLP